MNVPSVLLWGFVATVALTGLMTGSQTMGLTRMSIPFLLGTMITPDRDRALIYGSVLHFLNGLIVAFFYAIVFDALGHATWWIGGIIGTAHGLFILVAALPLLPGIHPRMADERQGPTPTRQLQPPGFLALHYGRRTPLLTLAAHIAYGVIFGLFYTVPR